jgi:hypothetical protein
MSTTCPPDIDLERASLRGCFCHLACVTEERAVFFTNGSTTPVRVPTHELEQRIYAIKLAFFYNAVVPWEFSLTAEQARSLSTEQAVLEEAQKQLQAKRAASMAERLVSV